MGIKNTTYKVTQKEKKKHNQKSKPKFATLF